MLKKRRLSQSREYPEMTLPDERYRAVKMAEQLLKDLCDRTATPRVPKIIRQRASGCLRHYPSNWDLQQAAEAAPQVFQERMEPLYRMIKQRDLEQDPETTNTLGDQT